MSDFKQYKRKGLSEMRPYVPGEDMSKISVSQTDTPEEGGMVARNPQDHNDQWYVAKKYFEENLEEVVMGSSPGPYGLLHLGRGSFGQALQAMKNGEKVCRGGWNGKGMFLYYVPANSYPPTTAIAKEAFNGEDVPYGAYIAMKTAQGNVVPWLASQTDVLSEDWMIID
jgi:hypothetical protein